MDRHVQHAFRCRDARDVIDVSVRQQDVANRQGMALRKGQQ